MKLAIMSDFHFGFNEDALMQAREALQSAIGSSADAIIIAGDLFDSRVPKQEVLHDAVSLFSETRKETFSKTGNVSVSEIRDGGKEEKIGVEGIPLIVIYGTHERRSKGLVNVIQILDSANLAVNCHARKIVLEKQNEDGRIVVQGLGGVPEEYLKRTLEVAGFSPVQRAFNIFVFHQTLQELIPVENAQFISIDELPPGFQIYVDGHVHWNLEMEQNGRKLLVPGSTVLTQMRKKEEKPKGYYLFDTASEKSEFVEIATRPFHLIELKFEDASYSEVARRCEEELERIAENGKDGMKPFVRMVLSGTLEKGMQQVSVDLDELVSKYSEQMVLYVEKGFEKKEFKEKMELLRQIREGKKSPKEYGSEILKNRMSSNGVSVKDEEALFDALAEGDYEKAEEAL